jgi:5-methyltetrahydrofolate--homocysteine methyltransferase
MGVDNEILSEIKNHLVGGNKEGVLAGVRTFLEQGFGPQQILQEALIPGMSRVGEKMASKEMFIPEVLVSAMVMKDALEIIKPLLGKDEMTQKGTIILGTVKGDIHDIGKNLVGFMLEGAGFRIIDLGVNIPPEKFTEAVKQHNPEIVGMSAMLTTTMPEMGVVIRTLKERGVRERVRVIVGGAAVSPSFASEIGADGYAEDAGSAVREIEKLLAG